ncbi:unnamed protein product [Schistocephalus solidus]|uniref:DUF1907 domain-containing protein n=1 Tax=Schistocephalus solidus TaxID=70667 RepID=A0A183SVC8_SCHSO|nr:unnamed protein product [Schistocephalus solidus]
MDVANACKVRAGEILGGGTGPYPTTGHPCEVIEVIAKRRLCEGSIGKFLHQALQSRYGRGDEPMALGGVFLLEGSGAKYHVLSELPNEPYHTFPDLKSYLKCFEMKAPIIGMGTVLSHDPVRLPFIFIFLPSGRVPLKEGSLKQNDLGLHMHSFHIYNVERNVAGHLETDTDPEAASYRIFLHPASHICRMDKPVY